MNLYVLPSSKKELVELNNKLRFNYKLLIEEKNKTLKAQEQCVILLQRIEEEKNRLIKGIATIDSLLCNLESEKK